MQVAEKRREKGISFDEYKLIMKATGSKAAADNAILNAPVNILRNMIDSENRKIEEAKEKEEAAKAAKELENAIDNDIVPESARDIATANLKRLRTIAGDAMGNLGSSEEEIDEFLDDINISDDLKADAKADMLNNNVNVNDLQTGPVVAPISEAERVKKTLKDKGLTLEEWGWIISAHQGNEDNARKDLFTKSANELRAMIRVDKNRDKHTEDSWGVGTYINPIGSVEYENGLFNSPEEVAYAFGMKYNLQSINEDKEYGANIFAVETKDGLKYSYDKAYRGTDNSIAKMAAADWLNRALLAISPIKSEEIPVGSVHTHSAWLNEEGESYDSTLFFSPQDEMFLLGMTYMISLDGALHYSQGNTSDFINKITQEYLQNKGYDYGEIVRHGLPYDSNTTPYKP